MPQDNAAMVIPTDTVLKLPPYTLAGFYHTTQMLASGDDTK
jgi:hypothetical protein